ncbi:MAG: hypothetical protein ABI372_03280 [Ginsengibacter sp.]
MKFLKFSFLILLLVIICNSCAKEYSSEKNLAPIGSWRFSNGSIRYIGYLDNFHRSTGIGSNSQLLTGNTLDNLESFELKIFTDSLAIGTYRASLSECSFLYTSANNTIYKANNNIGEFIVNVTALDSTHISGTFSGTASGDHNNLVQISQGFFDVQ